MLALGPFSDTPLCAMPWWAGARGAPPVTEAALDLGHDRDVALDFEHRRDATLDFDVYP